MRTKTLLLSLLLSFSAAASVRPAAGWVPVSCDDRAAEVEAMQERAGRSAGYAADWRRYEQEVRNAAPGDHKYVPHPYPSTPKQVFEDFRYGFLHRFVGSNDVGSWQRKTYDLLKQDKPSYAVERVENWNFHRCDGDRYLPFYHLVRIYDASGREIARAAVEESGILSIFSELDGEQGPLDDLTTVAETVRERFGVETKPTRAQYATLEGPPVTCSPVMPCVVFESESELYVVNHDYFLFAIEPGASRLGVLDVALRPLNPRALSVNAGRRSAPWIMVGYEAREGRLVAIGPRGGPLD